MSRTRRHFTSKFKSDLVIELLKGEKDLNTLAAENEILPNLLRNWKNEFLSKASIVFDDSREDNLKQKLETERKEKASYARKVGQLTMQVGLSLRKAAKLLAINRTSQYYHPKESAPSDEELECKRIIDRFHTDNPAWGARQLASQLQRLGHQVGRRKTSRYMREMGIDAIYPKMNLSKRQQQAQVVPYLLRNVDVQQPNQAWSIDITYIPLEHGYVYLTAIIDWYSRCIVGWEVDDTLDTRMVITAVRKALRVAKPQILNSDQGCQFTSKEYKAFLKEHNIRQSMDGKSRWADNIKIERWFRTFKYEEAYLTQYRNIREARKAIHNYINVNATSQPCYSMPQGLLPDTFRNLAILVLTNVPL